MALPRDLRIRRTGEFTMVRSKGASWTGRLLILAVLPMPDQTRARFGFTVTKRIGNAVVRNRIRRRLSSITGAAAPLIARAGLIVTIPRHGAARAEFSALEAEWTKLARRAGLLPAPPL